MDNLMNQVPDNLSREEVEIVYNKHNKDIIKTLEELWDIKTETKNLSENTIKWNNIRETCDSFDIEMQKNLLRR
jgi:superoxide dismutase